MNIIVLVKQVPDTTEVNLDPKTGNIVREGLPSILNPDDRHALEAALRLVEKQTGKITVITMGPLQAVDVISEALGMGADRGVLLSDAAFAGADTWATSFTLGKAIQKLGQFDLILCGRQAIDGDTAQIGPQVAEYLQVPQVTYVSAIESIANEDIGVRRRLEDGYEHIQCRLPAVLTIIAEMNRPRYPDMGRMIAACREKAPIKVWNAADIGVDVEDVGLEGSLTHVVKTFSPRFKRKGEMLEGNTEAMVKTLLTKLAESGTATGLSLGEK